MTAERTERAPSSLRLVLTLAVAGLISGIAIIGIYESTLPTITANKARELREAVFKVLPGVSRMQALVYRDDALVVVAEEAEQFSGGSGRFARTDFPLRISHQLTKGLGIDVAPRVE